MRKPSTKRPKRITARSITLVDSEGKARIQLDAGNPDGYANISLFGKNGGSIQISAQEDGKLVIALVQERSHVALTLNSAGDSELTLTDREGKLGAKLGSVFQPGQHELLLFQSGQLTHRLSGTGNKNGKKRRRAKG